MAKHDPYSQYSGPAAPQIQPMAVPGENAPAFATPKINPMAGPGAQTPTAPRQRLNPKQFISHQGGFKGLASQVVGAQQTAQVFSGKGGLGRALRYTLTEHVVGDRASKLYSEEAAQKISQMHTGGIDAD